MRDLQANRTDLPGSVLSSRPDTNTTLYRGGGTTLSPSPAGQARSPGAPSARRRTGRNTVATD